MVDAEAIAKTAYQQWRSTHTWHYLPATWEGLGEVWQDAFTEIARAALSEGSKDKMKLPNV